MSLKPGSIGLLVAADLLEGSNSFTLEFAFGQMHRNCKKCRICLSRPVGAAAVFMFYLVIMAPCGGRADDPMADGVSGMLPPSLLPGTVRSRGKALADAEFHAPSMSDIVRTAKWEASVKMSSLSQLKRANASPAAHGGKVIHGLPQKHSRAAYLDVDDVITQS